MVTLDNASTVIRNTAGGDGGGVHCRSTHDAGSVTLLRMGTTLVFDNEAVNGGGVAVDGCRNVFLYNGGPVVLIFPAGGILGNRASALGGGIHVLNGGEVSIRATEFLGFGDADEAALISGNSADIGGAADVRDADSRLLVEDAYVLNNTATLGAAFNVNLGGRLEVLREAGTGACAPVTSGGGVLSRPPCSVVDGNEASSGGGGFHLAADASADVSRTIIRNNVTGGGGGAVARLSNSSLYTGANSQMRIEGALMYGNSGGFLFRVANNADLIVSHSTVADNPGGQSRVTAAAGQQAFLRFRTSIVMTDTFAIGSVGGDGIPALSVDCVIGDVPADDSGVTTSFAYSQIGPEFRDPAARDYRLSATSPAIDYCDGLNHPFFPDLDGNPRDQVWNGPTPTPAPNPGGGPFDLGAYEIPYQVTNTDLALRTEPAGQSSLFVNSGEQIRLTLVVQNQSSNIAYGPVALTGELGLDPVFGEVWSCAPPPGAVCSPASGSGNISTTISRVAPGDQVFFFVEADPLQPNQDQQFEYSAIVTPSAFNLDSNLSNNSLLVEIRSGLFADGFE